DVRAEFNKDVARASINNDYEVHVFGYGGDGFKKIDDPVAATVTEKPKIEDIGVALKKNIGNLDKKNTPTVCFYVTEIRPLKNKEQEPWTQEREKRLLDLVDTYALLIERDQSLAGILSRHDIRYEYASDAILARFKSGKPLLAAARRIVSATHSACMEDRSA